MKPTSDHTGSQALYAAVRAGFILQNTTLGKWCEVNSVERTNARAALLGSWTGPRGRELIARLIADSHAEDQLKIRRCANG